jgi:outer membrane protein TolC
MSLKHRYVIGSLLLLAVASRPVALTLNEVLEIADQSAQFEEATASVEVAKAAVALAGIGGDLALSLQPNVSVTTPIDASFPGELRVTGTAGVSVPLGLTESQRFGLEQAEESLATATEELEGATQRVRYELALLYMDAWLSQFEREVLLAEYAVATDQVAQQTRLFESGVVSAEGVDSARSGAEELELALLENSRNIRIRWLELAYLANIDVTASTPQLVRPVVSFAPIPQPPELEAAAFAADRTLSLINDRITSLRGELTESDSLDILQSVRASFSMDSHAVSASFAPASQTLSANYSFPVFSYAAETPPSGGGSTDSWTLGLSLSFGYQANTTGELESQKIEAELALAEAELSYQRDMVSLAVRQKYQQHLLANGAVAQAEASLEAVTETRDSIIELRESQRATDLDLAVAEARVARSQYQLAAALIKRDEAALAIAAYTNNLEALWLSEEE